MSQSMPMKRIKYFDLLRVLSFVCIVYYHIVVQLHLAGFFSIDQVLGWYANRNMHIATLAVAIFFMLSGAALMHSTRGHFDLYRFFRRRFFRLLLPFYVATFGYWLLRLAVCRGNVSRLFDDSIPAWRVVFTLLGLDEWVSMHGYATFATGIGEWFLGALLLLYLVFPLLRILVLRFPRQTLLLGTLCYGVLLALDQTAGLFPVVGHMNLLFKGYEFLLGMYLGLYWQRLPKGALYASLALIVWFFFLPLSAPFPETMKITLLALAVFIVFARLEPVLGDALMQPVRVLADYSYETFLVHHIVIYTLISMLSPYIHNGWGIALLVAAQLAVIALAGIVVKRLSGLLLHLFAPHQRKKGT